MSDAGVPTEALQLPPERVILHHEALTVGTSLEDEKAVKEKYGFTGLSLAAKVEIPVEKTLEESTPGSENPGTRTLYLFQAGAEGSKDLFQQITEMPSDYEPIDLKPGWVDIMSEEELNALRDYRDAHHGSFDQNDFDNMLEGKGESEIVLPGRQITLGRDLAEGVRMRGYLVAEPGTAEKEGKASRRHVTVEVSPYRKVTLTDTSTNGTRVEVRPGYRKTPAPQTTSAS
jgi:hypothetical protein